MISPEILVEIDAEGIVMPRDRIDPAGWAGGAKPGIVRPSSHARYHFSGDFGTSSTGERSGLRR
jgi:hypothetical protein